MLPTSSADCWWIRSKFPVLTFCFFCDQLFFFLFVKPGCTYQLLRLQQLQMLAKVPQDEGAEAILACHNIFREVCSETMLAVLFPGDGNLGNRQGKKDCVAVSVAV